MKFLFTFYILVFSGATFLYANNISISGTVVNGESGTPIENADVYFHYKNHIKTKTDSQGKFVLSGTSFSGVYKPRNSFPIISIKNNFVNLQLATGSRAELSVFTITGKQVYSINAEFTGNGQKRIFLPTNIIPAGTYIISISCAKTRYIFRYLNLKNNSYGIFQNVNETYLTSKNHVSKALQNEAFSDILVVKSPNTQTGRMAIDSSIKSDIKVILMSIGANNSTPGIPLFTSKGGYGDVTTYGTPSDPEFSQGGACNYGSTGVLYYAAINVHQVPGDFKGDWQNGKACGRCAKVKVQARDGSVRTTVVRIMDRCADSDCGIDLGGAAAKIIMGNEIGRYTGEWEWVSCENAEGVFDGPASLYIKEGSNEWWSAAQLRNGPGGVSSIRAKKADETEWQTLSPAIEAENFYTIPPVILQSSEPWDFEITWETGSKSSLNITGNKLALEKTSYELVN